MRSSLAVVMVALLAGVFLCGCTQSAYVNPDEPDALGGTGIDSQDVRSVVQEMARDLVGADCIANAEHRPIIAVLPIRNDTAFRIDTDLFTRQLRNMLIKHAGSKVTFVARDRMAAVQSEREAKRGGEVSSSGEKQVFGADYFLTGTLLGLHKSAKGKRSDYVYYSFELIDAESSAVVWANDYDVKKVGKRGVLYR